MARLSLAALSGHALAWKRPIFPPAPVVRRSHYEELRWRFFIALEDPSQSWLGLLATGFIIFCILGSAVSYIVSTLPSMGAHAQLWWELEVMFVACFSAEYCIRYWAAQSTRRAFLTNAYNVVDVVAILPFYIELFMYMAMTKEQEQDLHPMFIRLLRSFRLFRILKIARYSTQMQLIAAALQRSAQSLGLLAFMMLVALILFGSAMYFCERGDWRADKGCYVRADGKCSPFESIPSSWYWGVATMTTVGYGDDIPHTELGKLVSMATMVVGIMVIALPVTIIGNDFVDAYTDVCKQIVRKKKDLNAVIGDPVHQDLYATVSEFETVAAELNEVLPRIRHGFAAHQKATDRVATVKEGMAILSPAYELHERCVHHACLGVINVMRRALPDKVA